MSFTKIFNDTSRANQLALLEEERTRRITGSEGCYVAIPVAIPAGPPSVIAPGTPMSMRLGWMVAIPGVVDTPTGPDRQALPFGLPNEDVAQDLVDSLNYVRRMRLLTTKQVSVQT